MKLLTTTVKLATVPMQCLPAIMKLVKSGKKLGPAERRASVKACGQKHRSALIF